MKIIVGCFTILSFFSLQGMGMPENTDTVEIIWFNKKEFDLIINKENVGQCKIVLSYQEPTASGLSQCSAYALYFPHDTALWPNKGNLYDYMQTSILVNSLLSPWDPINLEYIVKPIIQWCYNKHMNILRKVYPYPPQIPPPEF